MKGKRGAPTVAGVPRKDVFFVIDDSGSMASYSNIVREAIDAMVAIDHDSDGMTYSYKFISFSNQALYSEQLSSLPIARNSTNIEAAFKLLDERMAMSALPEELIVIFISDGCDNKRDTINTRLKALSGTHRFVKSTLFTVAVGNGFPTAMVVSALRPKYHNASDCLPLVFPIRSPSEVMTVFEQMSETVFNKDHFNVSMEYGENTTLSELEEGNDNVYNYFIVKCTNESDKDKCVALIHQATSILGNMLELAKEREREKKEALEDAMRDDARKPLASSILNVARTQRKRVQTAILANITLFNSFLEETVKGNLLSKLSDVEQAKVLSYGNVVGKHLVKSLKYHSADFAATKAHLAKVLAGYDEEQAEADAQVSDYIITQAEAMMDARDCAKEVLNNAESLVSIVDTVAVVGRLMNIKTCNGTQINPWLIQVKSIPTILQHMNTIDFFRLHSGEYKDVNRPGEVANCLLPVTRNMSPQNFLRGPLGAHVSTYLLCKNQELFFPNAMIAMQAALVTFCLQKNETFYQNVMEETYNSFVCLKAGVDPTKSNLMQYVQHVGSEKFREALVTESDDLPKHLKCEHLTKFIFALYLLIRDGTALSTAQLMDRMRACMVEMVGRGGEGGAGAIYQYIDHEKKHSPADVLGMVPTDAALKAFFLHEGNQVFTSSAKTVCKTSDACAITDVQGPADIPVSYMGLSRAALSSIFARLNVLAGNAPSAEFELPDRSERLAITNHGLANSSFERNVTKATVEPVELATLQGEMERAYGAGVCKQAERFFAPLFRQHFEQTHTGEVVLMPPHLRSQYKAETGRDITDDFSVSEETWLPNIACASPNCPNFLRRLGKAAVTKEGKPRMADAVLRHLQSEPLWLVHGSMRCAKELADEETVSEEQVRSTVALLGAGELMRDGGDMKKRKASQMENTAHCGGEESLKRLVKRRIDEYHALSQADVAEYKRFKEMMDAAYELPAVSAAQDGADASAEQEKGDDFEMIDAAEAGSWIGSALKSAGP